MRRLEVTVDITIPVTVTVRYSLEHDDDGCGDPSTTGNSMTGRRGRPRPVVDSVALTDPRTALETLTNTVAALTTDDDVLEAVQDDMDEYAD